MWRRIRTYFLTGLIVTAPIAITGYLAYTFVTTVDNLVAQLLPARYNPESYLHFTVPGLGLVVAFIALTLVGLLAANIFGRALIGLGERLLDRMPIIRSIYGTLKQITETISAQNASSFREVVLVEYPRRDVWALAFVSSEAKGAIQDATKGETLNVFLPTTPNPTSGFLLFVRREDVIVLDMTVDEAVKYVISAGLVAPKRTSASAGDTGQQVPLPVPKDVRPKGDQPGSKAEKPQPD